MSETLALYTPCKRCSGREAGLPSAPGEATWLYCTQCREPVITWGDYKAKAFEDAASRIRQRVRLR